MSAAPRVLITGCSSGIGLDCAHYLRARGWQVIATCRQPQDVAAREAEGFATCRLDLDDPQSIAEAVSFATQTGPIAALVNNGAFALPGAVEDLPRGGLEAVFRTNLFGTHDLTRRMIAHFRDTGAAGRVVTVSSVLGLVGIPWRGAYVASKFALEGLTDVLRLEMADTGIRIVLVEPGPIGTMIRQNSIPHFEAWIDWRASPRRAQYEASLLKRLYQPSGPDRFQLPPEAVSRTIHRALTARHPRARYTVTLPTRLAALSRRWLPDGLRDRLLRRA